MLFVTTFYILLYIGLPKQSEYFNLDFMYQKLKLATFSLELLSMASI